MCDPATGFAAASRAMPIVAKSSLTEPLSMPVVPTVETATVSAVAGAGPPSGMAEVTVGAAPPRFAAVRPKLPVAMPMTGSLKVTVQFSGPEFVGLVPTRTIETTVGCVLSTV